MDLLTAFRLQRDACAALGSPMYAELLERASDDIEAGSVVRDVLVGHGDRPGPSALALRLLGSVHRLVLERRAGPLATFYPSVGGVWEPAEGWAALQELLRSEPEAVREWLDRPPQTNEVGRATALFGGLLHLPLDLPVRLHEIGSSAGLNLRADRFGYVDDAGTVFGTPVRLEPAWRGRPLVGPPPRIVEASSGCSVTPRRTASPPSGSECGCRVRSD
jgi:hypothetical protein